MKEGTIKECTMLSLPTLIHLQELDHAYFGASMCLFSCF